MRFTKSEVSYLKKKKVWSFKTEVSLPSVADKEKRIVKIDMEIFLNDGNLNTAYQFLKKQNKVHLNI